MKAPRPELPLRPERAQTATTNQIPADRRYWVLGTVMLVQFVSILTSTIISTAAPTIVDDLHGLNLYAWLFSSYLLASSVTVPVVGKLSDLFGRRPFYIAGLLLFLIGSAVSGFSQNMGELIAARAVTGVGGGAMMALSVTTIGDIFSPRERGRWMGLIMSVFGLGSILGPLVGGFITDHLGWRWVFYVNIIPGLIALALLAALLPRLARQGRVRIDWIGIVLLIAGVVPLLIGLTWAGITYPWGSVQVITTMVGGGIILIAFAIWENHAAEPVLTLHLFESRAFTVAVIISFLMGIALFGALTFLPLYAQGVLGYSAQDAGLVLSPLMLGFVLGSLVGGQFTTRTGRYRIQSIIGMAIGVVGMFLLSRLSASTSFTQALIAMVVTGVGIGTVFPTLSVVVQSAFPYRLLGTANAARQFFNNLGAVMGVPVMATIVIETLKSELPNHLPPALGSRLGNAATSGAQGLIAGQSQGLTDAFGKLPPAVAKQVLGAVRDSLAIGTSRAFLLATVLTAVG
ncbi:MAG TPA: MDR family MFS transporter, partial [Candidatus Dormibacteraeota bacterium]|nr:MDR family MFS transporter [Candidatus Dormibacteraeota bacterium]